MPETKAIRDRRPWKADTQGDFRIGHFMPLWISLPAIVLVTATLFGVIILRNRHAIGLPTYFSLSLWVVLLSATTCGVTTDFDLKERTVRQRSLLLWFVPIWGMTVPFSSIVSVIMERSLSHERRGTTHWSIYIEPRGRAKLMVKSFAAPRKQPSSEEAEDLFDRIAYATGAPKKRTVVVRIKPLFSRP